MHPQEPLFLIFFVPLQQRFSDYYYMKQNSNYRLAAEWEPQSGVQLTWPHAQTDWAPMLNEIEDTYRVMAREIMKREPLLVVAPAGINPFPDENDTKGLTLCAISSNDTWARDHGFLTLVNDETGDCRLLDFCFNGWGEKFEAALDNAINRRLYEGGWVRGTYEDHLDFVLEGGSIESDGKGTIFTTTGCLMAPHRNQPLSKEQIEERLKDSLCAQRVLWIDYGHLAGDDTDGHIDTLVRICPDDTLLYIGCDDPDDEHYDDLQKMEQQLATFRTIDGSPYRLLRLPLPRPIFDEDGERLPATYANYLVVNGAVLVPTYNQPDLDQQALDTIQKAFPGREIVGIDCRAVILQHGSLHCCTMQYPEKVLRQA